MTNFSKRIINAKKDISLNKEYKIDDALNILKKHALSSFIEKIDIAINLNIDTKTSNNYIHGAVKLPYSLKKRIRIAVFVQNKLEEEEAKLAGADLVGSTNLYEQIKKKEINFDIIISSPNSMKYISELGHILGPRNLMPNLKLGTITSNFSDAINNLRFGITYYKSDKYGIIHASIGKTDFSFYKVKKNLQYFISAIQKSKPLKVKGSFFKRISLSNTMSPSILIDKCSLSEKNFF